MGCWCLCLLVPWGSGEGTAASDAAVSSGCTGEPRRRHVLVRAPPRGPRQPGWAGPGQVLPQNLCSVGALGRVRALTGFRLGRASRPAVPRRPALWAPRGRRRRPRRRTSPSWPRRQPGGPAGNSVVSWPSWAFRVSLPGQVSPRWSLREARADLAFWGARRAVVARLGLVPLAPDAILTPGPGLRSLPGAHRGRGRRCRAVVAPRPACRHGLWGSWWQCLAVLPAQPV